MNLIRDGIEVMDAVVDGACAPDTLPDAIRAEVPDAGISFKGAERAFEPYFATRQQEIGMGLSICRSTIDSHGGRLWMADDEAGEAA
ncbi:ATP-binding protein [Sinorhizobium terangae]|uniref:ATP-binding protein n=1 Tax=Sinorhizobium terangae TaxID=110322 RepID=UPI0024B0D1DC|nr:ATP-binding protein [Sinorhizobium terangae]WFU49843.1 hypothetical protein QA637_23805 [Sinorhizobium terangae]